MNNITIPINPDDLEDWLIGFLDDIDVRTDYSGRGMYGETCFGLVVETNDLLVGFALGALLDELGLDPYEVLSRARTDNMGYNTIVYFPGCKLAE